VTRTGRLMTLFT